MTKRDPAVVADSIAQLRAAVDPSIIHGSKKITVRIAALRDLLVEYDHACETNRRLIDALMSYDRTRGSDKHLVDALIRMAECD